MVVRHAMTMIELIFAIVLIGIAVAGVPRMIERNNRSLESNIVDEAVFAVSAKAAQVLSFRWDDNSQNAGDLLSHSKILDVAGSGGLSRTNSIFRIGGIAENAHRRFHSAVAGPASNELSGMTTGSALTFITGGDATSATAYKKDYQLNVAASFVGDGNAAYNTGATASATYNFPNFPSPVSGTATNMKMVKIELQQNDSVTATPSWTNVATLYVYAANIGEIDYFKRTMQ
ncbi:prepilin-type N-terminal cleavage/methylation domain-containing protein [Sulfurimonas sp. HSL-1656]|uniref:prepilin-type N-terminal cleavage/methylation domain-containing protein n=1 Tax=Thiomicrolovo subterrani TaxID=3131934 RepID=UPI0031F97883